MLYLFIIEHIYVLNTPKFWKGWFWQLQTRCTMGKMGWGTTQQNITVSKTQMSLSRAAWCYLLYCPWMFPLRELSVLSGSWQLRSGGVGRLFARVSSELHHHWQGASQYTPLIPWQAGSSLLDVMGTCARLLLSKNDRMTAMIDLIWKQ